MAPSSSSPSSKSPPPPTTTYFTPIQEEDGNESTSTTTPNKATPKHTSTPLHYKHGKRHSKKRSEISAGSSSATREEEEIDDMSVNCNKCRPNGRERISVVPLDTNSGFNRKNGSSSSVPMASPNGILKSILSSFTRKSSPKLPMDPYAAAREEKWKIAVAELSQKLIQTTRKRDEAVLEASRLKYSMAELEKKLNKLEVYCHGLKSGLEECSTGNSPYNSGSKTAHHKRQSFNGFNDSNKAVVEHFLVAVSEARTAVRLLSRSLTMQLRHMAGTKVYDKITVLLHPYDIKLSLSKNPRSLLFYLEALLNKTFFDEFESPGFCKNSGNHILNPVEKCEANYASFNMLGGLTWYEVLIKGTRHFSEEFSRFCDRKMSDIVAMLGWNRAWPEPLLQAFFGAAKSVWLVHLLATSVHPSLPVFRVESGVGFDSVYMEDMGGDKARKLVPSVVRIMVAPGFYVYGSVVKCKVLCRYNSNINGLTPSSP
ncbi:IRK-interacting protein [Argentina anserina]|uniref:IRK-interacting protein n=1 Tax=Argentina anserina TaxID=57926 RepID=UPI0021764DD0|nr:IRK-interacting protein [Potentilla anserina]